MTIYSGIFNSVRDNKGKGDRIYDAWWFAKYFSTFIGNGVFPNPSTNLQVIEGTNMQVNVRAGKGWIDGYFLYNDSNLILRHDIASGTQNRIDRIVMRLDFLTRQIEIAIKKGANSTNPRAPLLKRDTDAYELALADVYIAKGAVRITQADITDQRLNSAVCGIVTQTVKTVDTTTLFNQYQSWMDQQKVNYETDFAQWSTTQKANFESWSKKQETEFTNWMKAEKKEFDDWFSALQDILNENGAAVLVSKVSALEKEMTSVNEELSNQEEKINNHLSEKITSIYGLHGQIRYRSEKLQIKVGSNWIDYTGGTKVAVRSVSDFVVTSGDAKVTLTWQDPPDVEIDGSILAKWKGTRILRKVGSYPRNENDGVTVIQNGFRDQYKTNGYVDSGLTNDTTYFYSAFAYTVDDVFSPKTDASATPRSSVIYGVRINTNNSNNETAMAYTDDAIGLTPAKGNDGNFSYGSWEDKFPFNQIKPCVLKDGVVNYYLNPNDYTKKLDGGNANITGGKDGDVMVEFPKIYWKFEHVGTRLYIRYSDKQVDSTYKCLAHTRGTSEKDKIYLSAYMGSLISSKLRSLSGKTPVVSQNISQFRTLAQANGEGYEQSTYYQILMLQVLYIVMFKNRDSQTALGRGYVDGNSSSISTGGTNAKGMFYGETTGKLQNKFCGIEDFWGNAYYWVDGLFCDASRNILIGNNNYNDTGNGYTNYGQGAVSNLKGYIDKVEGGTESGFIIKSGGGSATTYYADYGFLSASYLPRFGGYWSSTSSAGAFRLEVSSSASSSDVYQSARLSLC